jgi:hypothetical protein
VYEEERREGMVMKKDFSDEITKVAYDLYEKRGKMHGYALEDWLQAEKIIMKRHIREIEKESEAISSTKKERASGEKTLKKKQSLKETTRTPIKKVTKKK